MDKAGLVSSKLRPQDEGSTRFQAAPIRQPCDQM